LYYNAPIGWVKLSAKGRTAKGAIFQRHGPGNPVGPDLAGKELTFAYFQEMVKKGHLPIKN